MVRDGVSESYVCKELCVLLINLSKQRKYLNTDITVRRIVFWVGSEAAILQASWNFCQCNSTTLDVCVESDIQQSFPLLQIHTLSYTLFPTAP